MAVSDSTTLNDLIGTIVSSAAQSAAYAARVMRPLVRATEVPAGSGSITIPRFQAITVAGLTEATVPGTATITSDGVLLTPVERGAYAVISKSTLHADPWSDLSPYGNQIGRALAQDEDAMIIGAMDPATRVNDQTGGVDNIALADLLTAIGNLEGQNAPGPYFAVFHPVSWSKIRAGLDDAATFASVGKQVVEGFGHGFTQMNGYVGSPYGVPCFISTEITTFNGAGTPNDSYLNLMFSQEACGYAYTKDIGVDIDDNVPARAFDLMGWYAGDADELVDLYSVAIEDDVNG
jgi:hypothetical protein